MSSFYKVVGPRVSGMRAVHTKHRMKDWEAYMSGFGGHGGHLFRNTPTSEQYVVRQTNWMDQRAEAGWAEWSRKMQGRMWRRSKYFLPPLLIGSALVVGFWELLVFEYYRHERKAYH